MSRSFIFVKNDIKRCSSAGRLSSSPAGAVTSLILMSRNKRTAITSLILFGVLSGMAATFFGNSDVYATNSTLTLTVGDIVSADVLASSSGSFAFGTGTVSVTTDYTSGYILTIAASSDSDNGALTGTNGTIPTIDATCTNNATSISESDFISRTECNDMWGYKPSYYDSATNTNYLPSPTTTGDTLDVTYATNATAKTYDITLGAKVTDDIVPGSYAKTFVVTAVGNILIPYTISYNDGIALNIPNDVSSSTDESSITLDSAVPTASGYAFLGWCTVQPTRTNNTDDCTGGIQYDPGATYQLSNGANLDLYAMWGPDKIYIQNLDITGCQVNVGANGNSANIGDNITAVDARDNKEYTVRYIDGACWMTQNLRYLGDTGSAAGTMTIGGNNSNVANKFIRLYSLNSSDAGNFNLYPNHCDSTNGYNYACVYDSGSTATGVWYNYYAASGGTVSGSSNSTVASNDICPAGWHLPDRNSSAKPAGSIDRLIGLSPTDIFAPITGGRYTGGSLSNTGGGYWWSKTASSTSNRNRLYWSGSSFSVGNYSRDNGIYIRCTRNS